MKRNIFTAAIPALLIASSVNAIEIYHTNNNKLNIYGKIVGLHYLSEDNYYDGSKSRINLGIKGETKINDFLTGYGQWEYKIKFNNSEGFNNSNIGNKTELGFTGIKFSNYGTIDYGRNYGIIYDVTSWTDMLPEFGSESVIPNNFLAGRSTGVATYRNYNFFNLVNGLNFAIQFQGKSNQSNIQSVVPNGYGWGFSTTYTSPYGFGIAGAYSTNKHLNSKITTQLIELGVNHNQPATSWNTAIKYDANNLYLAFMYSKTQKTMYIQDNASKISFADEVKTTKILAQYQFNFGLRPSIAYTQSNVKPIENLVEFDLLKYVDLSATYLFNKNMSTYIDCRINALSNTHDTNNIFNVMSLGLVYKF